MDWRTKGNPISPFCNFVATGDKKHCHVIRNASQSVDKRWRILQANKQMKNYITYTTRGSGIWHIYNETNSYPPRPKAEGDMSLSHCIYVIVLRSAAGIVYMSYPTTPEWYKVLNLAAILNLDHKCGVWVHIPWLSRPLIGQYRPTMG